MKGSDVEYVGGVAVTKINWSVFKNDLLDEIERDEEFRKALRFILKI